MPGHFGPGTCHCFMMVRGLAASAATLPSTSAATTATTVSVCSGRSAAGRTWPARCALPRRHRSTIGTVEVRLVLFVDLLRLIVVVEVLSAFNENRALI